MSKKLDEVDISILNNLQKNGRMTNVELATKAGISAPPCLRRLKALEDNGIIVGYHADLNRDVLGFGLTVICLISLSKQNHRSDEDFVEFVGNLENVRECFSVTGDFDYVLKIVAKDLKDYENFLNTGLRTFPDIGAMKTYVAIRNDKNDPGIPVAVK